MNSTSMAVQAFPRNFTYGPTAREHQPCPSSKMSRQSAHQSALSSGMNALWVGAGLGFDSPSGPQRTKTSALGETFTAKISVAPPAYSARHAAGSSLVSRFS